MNNIHRDIKLADLVLLDHYYVLMLSHFNIHMPYGDKTIDTACIENKINPEVFLLFAGLFDSNQSITVPDLSEEDISTVISYLGNCHKYYLEEKYPSIKASIDQMMIDNGSREMKLVDVFFKEYINEVSAHLDYENKIVYPYIYSLCNSKNEVNSSESEFSVSNYKDHHDDIEEKLSDLKNILIKYLPGDNDQQIRRKLIFNLFELEFDLNIHTKIEDNILIPIVEKLESKEYRV